MRVFKAGLRPAFGMLLIAHGLAHSVLPLRGWMDPSMTGRESIPVIFYSVAVLGFTIAGLGVFGVRPFTAILRPALVLASAYSLIAILLIGHRDLWFGGGLNVVLFIIGVSGAYRRLPATPHRRTAWRLAGTTTGIALVTYACAAVLLWPLHRGWGSPALERLAALPGDLPDRNPAFELQHTVTVDAPPEEVWRWLVQLGHDRAGFYSYDWLERAFGVQIRNVNEIRPEWQTRNAGDLVHATQPNYLGGVFGDQPGWRVDQVIPGRAMVLQYWGAFVLEPAPDGRTRFIVRTKVGASDTPVWAAALDMIAFELPHFIMERRMMLRIKALAEDGKVS